MNDEDVLAQKITSLQRCVARARDTHAAAGQRFREDFNLQDAAILNVIRACETALDLANMAIRRQHLGIPAESRESFQLLARENVIDHELADALVRMVGFRNLAVHQYTALDLDIVEAVIERELGELLTLAETVRQSLAAPE